MPRVRILASRTVREFISGAFSGRSLCGRLRQQPQETNVFLFVDCYTWNRPPREYFVV